jgi:chromosome segregation ATPase
MITNRDVADKKNEVTMLRLERDEVLIRRQLDRAKQKSELDDVLPSRNELRDFIRAQNKALKDFQDEINKKHTTVDELNDAIVHLEADLKASHTNNAALSKALEEANTTLYNAKNAVEGLEAELSARKDDSRVLMQVVEAIRDNSPIWWTLVVDIVEDYLNAPEGVTIKTPSIGTRVVSKNEETHIIDEDKMVAVRLLVECEGDWILHTDSEAAYRNNPLSDQVADRDNRIEQLIVLNEALRIDIELAHNLSRDHITNQDRIIEGLRSQMTGARVIIDNQATSIEELTLTLAAYREQNINQHNKLERIEKIAEHPAYDCFSTALDEIIKIIQEE